MYYNKLVKNSYNNKFIITQKVNKVLISLKGITKNLYFLF